MISNGKSALNGVRGAAALDFATALPDKFAQKFCVPARYQPGGVRLS